MSDPADAGQAVVPGPKNPHGVRTPGDEPTRKPIPAGSLSDGAMFRNALEAAGDPDADTPNAEAVADYVAIRHAETGRDDKIPGKL